MQAVFKVLLSKSLKFQLIKDVFSRTSKYPRWAFLWGALRILYAAYTFNHWPHVPNSSKSSWKYLLFASGYWDSEIKPKSAEGVSHRQDPAEVCIGQAKPDPLPQISLLVLFQQLFSPSYAWYNIFSKDDAYEPLCMAIREQYCFNDTISPAPHVYFQVFFYKNPGKLFWRLNQRKRSYYKSGKISVVR